MNFETVIGLEVHCQLATESKLFCSCPSKYQLSEPNSLICEVCVGFPGSLPVINEKAIEYAIIAGLALNSKISNYTRFDRKNYSYPDLMKGYQISQFLHPVAESGNLSIKINEKIKQIGITRIHVEEDVAKLVHSSSPSGEQFSLLDINRSGTPLIEIVSEPDMRSPEEARTYLTTLRTILRYLDISTANMEEGSFRCDANISIRPEGTEKLGTKVELKNMNSFKSIFQALNYEVKRQTKLLLSGKSIIQETRGWSEQKNITVSQRIKEDSDDYRYFPEPDIPPLELTNSFIDQIGSTLPELPDKKIDRFIQEYELSKQDAISLTVSKSVADFFENTLLCKPTPTPKARAKMISNYILVELKRLLNTHNTKIQDLKFKPSDASKLFDIIDSKEINNNQGKIVFEKMFLTGNSPNSIIKSANMSQVSDSNIIESAIDQAIESNQQAVTDYLNGKEAALQFLFGQVMKITKGSASTQIVSELLQKKLKS